MKADNDNLDRKRFYEITDIPEDSVWYDPPESRYCALGAIVKPMADVGRFVVIKPTRRGYLTPSANDDTGLYIGKDITLRPLNKRDQDKLQRVRDQYA